MARLCLDGGGEIGVRGEQQGVHTGQGGPWTSAQVSVEVALS